MAKPWEKDSWLRKSSPASIIRDILGEGALPFQGSEGADPVEGGFQYDSPRERSTPQLRGLQRARPPSAHQQMMIGLRQEKAAMRSKEREAAARKRMGLPPLAGGGGGKTLAGRSMGTEVGVSGGFGEPGPPEFDPSSMIGQYSGDLFKEMSTGIYEAADQAMGAAVSNMVGRNLGRSTLAPGSNIVAARTKALGSASRTSRTEGARLGLAGAKAQWESEMGTWQEKVRKKESGRQSRLQDLRTGLGFA